MRHTPVFVLSLLLGASPALAQVAGGPAGAPAVGAVAPTAVPVGTAAGTTAGTAGTVPTTPVSSSSFSTGGVTFVPPNGQTGAPLGPLGTATGTVGPGTGTAVPGGGSGAVGGGTMGPFTAGQVPGFQSAPFGGGTIGPYSPAIPGGTSGSFGAGTMGPYSTSVLPGANFPTTAVTPNPFDALLGPFFGVTGVSSIANGTTPQAVGGGPQVNVPGVSGAQSPQGFFGTPSTAAGPTGQAVRGWDTGSLINGFYGNGQGSFPTSPQGNPFVAGSTTPANPGASVVGAGVIPTPAVTGPDLTGRFQITPTAPTVTPTGANGTFTLPTTAVSPLGTLRSPSQQ